MKQNIQPGPARSGATLVEILMSLMVMSIGLVSVASLFPISMLRSIQATQLTSAALLQCQVEDYLHAFPLLARNHFNGTAVVPNHEYRLGANHVAAWRYRLTSGNYASQLPINVVTVIDPVGAYFLNRSGFAFNHYGSDDAGLQAVNENMYRAERLNAGLNLNDSGQRNLAFSMFTSQDSWETAFTGELVGFAPESATLVRLTNETATSDLQVIADALAGSVPVRVMLVSPDRRHTHTSPVQLIDPSDPPIDAANRTIRFTRPIPDNGHFTQIAEVRLMTYEPRYSSLITVRRRLSSLGPGNAPGQQNFDDDGAGGVDDLNEVAWPGTDDVVTTQRANLVVFFRRNFTSLDEQVYEADSNMGEPQQVRIRWNNPDNKPNLKAGGWLFDCQNGYWYRIASIVVPAQPAANPRNPPNTIEAVVAIDRSLEANVRFLTVPSRVVEVFDLSL